MINELVRQIGVQQRLDRGVRCVRVQQILPLGIDHILVGQGRQLAQPVERLTSHGRMSIRLDHRQIAPAAFDAEHVYVLAEQVRQPRLHRGIAAAMHDKPWHSSKQARGIGAQSQVLTDTQSGVVGNAGARILIGPKAVHRSPRSSYRRSSCGSSHLARL